MNELTLTQRFCQRPRLSRGSFWVLPMLIGAVVWAAEPAMSGAADAAGVRAAGKDFLTALERRDTKALADFWTADGTYTDEHGRTFKVRDLLANGTAVGPLASPSCSVSNQRVRFVTDDVAIEEADCEATVADGLPAISGRYTAVWVHQSGRWKLDSLQEVRLANAPVVGRDVPSLGVFAGDWSGATPQGKVHISAKWDSGKKFLQRVFSITDGTSSLGGTQEIGWDPTTQRIKSWSFHDDGSYGEGVWSLEGAVWMEVSWRALADGRIVKATQVYKFPDRGTIIWKLIHGSVDEHPTEATEIVLKRSSAPE